jgi:hypothetical protein
VGSLGSVDCRFPNELGGAETLPHRHQQQGRRAAAEHVAEVLGHRAGSSRGERIEGLDSIERSLCRLWLWSGLTSGTVGRAAGKESKRSYRRKLMGRARRDCALMDGSG